MNLAWFYVFAFAVLACVFALAQQPSNSAPPMLAFDDGRIENNVYTNECLGFSLPIPDGWRTFREKAKVYSGAGIALLALVLDKDGTFEGGVHVNARDPNGSTMSAQEFVSKEAHAQIQRPGGEVIREVYPIEYGGRQFFRADIKQTAISAVPYYALVYTKFRGFYVGGSVLAPSPELLDQSANTLQHISFGEDQPNPRCAIGASGDGPGGYVGLAVIGASPNTPSTNSANPQRVRVSSGVSIGLLVSKVAPRYPDDAKQAHIQGHVVLLAEIDKNGDIEKLSLVSGHPLLAPAAIEAVKQWKYRPYLLNGQAAAVETQIDVVFRMSGR
jgi:TonB family protein